MWLAPSSNIGPITAFVIAPIGFVFGGIVGLLGATVASKPLRAMVIGGVAGGLLIVTLSYTTGSGIRSAPDIISIVASVVVFAITALLAVLVCSRNRVK